MIVSRMTFAFPKAAWNTANSQGPETTKLFDRIAGGNVTQAEKQTSIEQMSLAELLYSALVTEQNAAF